MRWTSSSIFLLTNRIRIDHDVSNQSFKYKAIHPLVKGVRDLKREKKSLLKAHSSLSHCPFFLKISKEIGKAWRKSRAREAREPHTPACEVLASLPSLSLCFQPRSRPFVWLLARTWIRKNTNCFAVYSRARSGTPWGSVVIYPSQKIW